MNVVAIPIAAAYWGNAAAGAAIVTVTSELLMIAFAIRMIGPSLDRAASASVLGRALLSSAVMAACVLLALPYLGPIAVVPLGLVTYGAVAFFVGLLTRAELATTLAALRTRRAPVSS